MKKTTAIIIILILSSAEYLSADYVNPPDWQSSLGYAHQSWDFDADYDLPAVADGEPDWINHFGYPNLVAVDYNVPEKWQHLIPNGFVCWMESYSDPSFDSDRTGYYGGMGDVTLTFEIPGREPSQDCRKLFWVQMTYYARNDGGKTFDMEVGSDVNFSDAEAAQILDSNVIELDEPTGSVGKWYQATRIYKIAPDSNRCYLRLTAYRYPMDQDHAMGGPAMIDQVDIDCRTVNIADLNYDYIIDMTDFALFANQWQYGGEGAAADLNSDGIVDFLDLEMFVSQWQYSWQRPIADLNADDVVNIIDFAEFAAQWKNSGENLKADLDGSLTVDTNDLATFSAGWLEGF